MAAKKTELVKHAREHMRGIENALKTGVKFSERTARRIIHLMKNDGLLCDAQGINQDGDMVKKLDEMLNTLKEF